MNDSTDAPDDTSLAESLAALKAHYSTSLQEDLQARLDEVFRQHAGGSAEEIAPALREIGGLDREARKAFLEAIRDGERPLVRAEK